MTSDAAIAAPRATLSAGQLAQVRSFILDHAHDAHPAEACGLIVSLPAGLAVDQTVEYVPCRNELAGTAAGLDRFRIHPEDWAAAEDLGNILAVVHSHPNADAAPTQADLVMCERTGVSWVIVGCPSGATTLTHPTGYEAPLIGRQFFHGVLDCYSLCRDYYARELGIVLPDYPRDDGWWERADHGDLYRSNYAQAGFVLVDGPPRRHDALLMQVAARCDNHAAIFLGDGTILHHLYGRQSGHDVYGGYWAMHTTAVLRHHSLLDAEVGR